METKYKVIISTVVIVGSFAAGRYSAPISVKEKEKTDVSTNKVEKVKKKVVKEKTTKPDGTIVERTTKEDINTVSEKTKEKTETSKDVEGRRDLVNISLLGGWSFYNQQPIYGLYVSKNVLGPITLGAFGLTQMGQNNIFGVAVGLSL